MTLKTFIECIKDIGGEEDDILIIIDEYGNDLRFKIMSEDEYIQIIIMDE